jgi:hypothetical protein
MTEPTNEICPRCYRTFSDYDATAVVATGVGDIALAPYRIHVECRTPHDV